MSKAEVFCGKKIVLTYETVVKSHLERFQTSRSKMCQRLVGYTQRAGHDTWYLQGE